MYVVRITSESVGLEVRKFEKPRRKPLNTAATLETERAPEALAWEYQRSPLNIYIKWLMTCTLYFVFLYIFDKVDFYVVIYVYCVWIIKNMIIMYTVQVILDRKLISYWLHIIYIQHLWIRQDVLQIVKGKKSSDLNKEERKIKVARTTNEPYQNT